MKLFEKVGIISFFDKRIVFMKFTIYCLIANNSTIKCETC